MAHCLLWGWDVLLVWCKAIDDIQMISAGFESGPCGGEEVHCLSSSMINIFAFWGPNPIPVDIDDKTPIDSSGFWIKALKEISCFLGVGGVKNNESCLTSVGCFLFLFLSVLKWPFAGGGSDITNQVHSLVCLRILRPIMPVSWADAQAYGINGHWAFFFP